VNIPLADPTYVPAASPGLFERAARRVVNDPRDVPFVKLIVTLTVLVIPSAVYLFLPGCFRWWLAAAYLGGLLYFLGPFILMLHNTSHGRLFKRQLGWMNLYIPWVLGPFFGETPDTYFAHHIGMHHPENNLPDDLSTTMPYQRDSAKDFLRYLVRFFVSGLTELSIYFWRRKRYSLMRRTIVGELSFVAVAAVLFAIDWRAALVVAVVPVVFTRSAMMAGNWGQHAFVDAAAPGNAYRNSITCINSGYNRRCFNDGYHIGHHVKATRHWTEMPGDFDRNRATYAREGAIVFAGLDFFAVWLLLMLKRYDVLAKRFVDLEEPGADGKRRSLEEIEALLRTRTRKCDPPSLG
jgi:Fatty acid desaturase